MYGQLALCFSASINWPLRPFYAELNIFMEAFCAAKFFANIVPFCAKSASSIANARP